LLPALAAETGATAIYCSRQYEPWAGELEQSLHDAMTQQQIVFKRYPGSLLFEPGQVLNQSEAPFKVFTPFWRACLRGAEPALPKAAPDVITWHAEQPAGDTLASWQLTPTQPDWAQGWDEIWSPGSEGAARRLSDFLAGPVSQYSEGRNHPSQEATSRLSPHLHFGELSPRTLWHAARGYAASHERDSDEIAKFLSELGWREFSHHLLHFFPHMANEPFKEPFRAFPWLGNERALDAWQHGQTGYPIVDAGMRELWQTGYMHNRVRMVVASFLTKHLLVHWRAGARWFNDTLVDADLANNSCGWQWVAGSGADASPYFRIFNPVTQGEKFDKEGEYVRHWVPELAALPDRYLHKPWDAPTEVLEKAGVTLGKTYPQPVVDHRQAREAALAAYASIRGNTGPT
jgi:deoxyribodipyrimidine photo-lyase